MLALLSRLGLLTRGRFASPASLDSMYAARLYGGGGGGGGGGGKPSRRVGQTVQQNHHLPHPTHHPHIPPPQSFPHTLYQSRVDAHRPFYQPHQHYHPHPPAPQPPPPYYQPHAHIHQAKKKTWNFIHEKMSYDTFFTMKRLIDRSRAVDEVLRWVTQNPAKISHNHYPIALQKIGQLLALQQAAGGGGGAGEAAAVAAAASAGGSGDTNTRQITDLSDFQMLCEAIINDCAKFDNFSIVNCLYAVAALGKLLRKRIELLIIPEEGLKSLEMIITASCLSLQVCPATLGSSRYSRRSHRDACPSSIRRTSPWSSAAA